MTELTHFQIDPFKPGWGIRGGHAQTIAGRFTRNRYGIIFHRRRLQTPDGDFIDLDFPEIAGYLLDESAPLVLLLHGLEGNARKAYACETYYCLAQHGIRSVGLNYRSCSGEMNKKPYSYHAGATGDVNMVYQLLDQRYPDVPKGIIGFSLGANLVLKYLGELGANVWPSLKTAVAVSPPFDLQKDSISMGQGLNKIYSRIFLRAIHRKIVAKSDIIQEVVDLDSVLKSTSIIELDKIYTAPINGFKDENDYYEQCSSVNYIANITIPTLILRAIDDPLFDPDGIPHDSILSNPNIHSVITPNGGHLGYIEGRPLKYSAWAEKQGAKFLGQFLQQKQTSK